MFYNHKKIYEKKLDLDYINSNFIINKKFYCIEKNTVYKIKYEF